MNHTPIFIPLIAALIAAAATVADAQPRFEDGRHHRNHGDELCGDITFSHGGLKFERSDYCGGRPVRSRRDDFDWNDRGAPAILFERPGFGGAALPLDGSIRDLGAVGFDDRASSIRVRRGVWQGCTEPNYRGRCWTVSGDESRFDAPADDRIRSVRRLR